jgi:Trk K+ transport system NAD-binding subunit
VSDQARHGHIVVFGFQGVARRIVKQLARTGRPILVVEPAFSPSERDTLRRYGVDFLEGFGQSEDTLTAVEVGDAFAALCVTDDDLRNIEIALQVRERSADVRIVVQMANAGVGRALTSVTHPGAVLEVAELASMSFVEAATQRTTHTIDLAGEDFVIATVACPERGSLRSLWGDRAPIAVRPADGSATVSCPSRDYVAEPGDLITLLGTSADYREAGLEPRVEQASASRRTWRRRLREALAAMADAVDRPFRIAFGVLAVLSILSVVVLTIGYQDKDGTHMNVLDAVYFTSETIATVGFGDYYFRDQPDWLRIWAIVLILLGAVLVALATALLTNALVSRRLAQSLGRQRLTGMKDHIVVIGLGSVGSKVAMDLRAAGYDVAVVDVGTGQRFIPQMNAARIPVVIGDPTLPETQADAGVRRAAGIAVLTNDDLTNIETGLAVRDAVGERPVPIVLRVFGRNLARVVGESLDAGVTRSIAELAAPWFVGAALGLNVLGTFYVGETPFMAARITVRAGGSLDGVAIQDLGAATRVVAIKRADGIEPLEHPLPRDARLHVGDSAFLVGQYEDLVELLQPA